VQRQGDSGNGRKSNGLAFGFRHAFAFLVPQITFFAEAAFLASKRATLGQTLVACGLAERSTIAVLLIVTALFRFFLGSQDLDRVGLLWALGDRNAVVARVPDVPLLAETTFVAAQRTEHGQFIGVASWLAHWTAGAVFFVGRCAFLVGLIVLFRNGQLHAGYLHRDVVDLFALFRANAGAIGRFQIALGAETCIDAWQNAEWTWEWIGASWSAWAAAGAVFGVLAALASRWRSWYSHSKSDSTQSAEQERGEAKGHR